MTMKGALIAASLAGLFSAATSTAMAEGAKEAARDGDKVMCAGVNACKGHGACKSAGNACAGKNGCKGKGLTKTSKESCKAEGGTVGQADKAKEKGAK